MKSHSVVTVKTTLDNTAKVFRGIAALLEHEVLVGFPEEGAPRKEGEITNAALGYIHEHGAPEVNIPARPFMYPGLKSVQSQISDGLRKAGELALDGRGADAVERQYERVGMIGQNGVKSYLNAGVSPPLKESTLKARARRGRKGAAKELKARAGGAAPGLADAKPLIDSGQLRNAVTFIVRKVKLSFGIR